MYQLVYIFSHYQHATTINVWGKKKTFVKKISKTWKSKIIYYAMIVLIIVLYLCRGIEKKPTKKAYKTLHHEIRRFISQKISKWQLDITVTGATSKNNKRYQIYITHRHRGKLIALIILTQILYRKI